MIKTRITRVVVVALIVALFTRVVTAQTAVTDTLLGAPGSRVHVRMAGRASSPTVVFVSGLGGPTSDWDNVFDNVSAFARVVAYDRPGLGKSDPGPAPRTVSRMTSELHEMLVAL